jgi:hypothetical protein
MISGSHMLYYVLIQITLCSSLDTDEDVKFTNVIMASVNFSLNKLIQHMTSTNHLDSYRKIKYIYIYIVIIGLLH